jgi:hypothetical protein
MQPNRLRLDETRWLRVTCPADKPMVQRSEWTGAFATRSDVAELTLTMTLKQSTRGGSGSFLGVASDGQRYWIKPLNNQQGTRVPATEQIVARAGALMGAPTCIARTVHIPSEFVGWEFRTGSALEQGIAHASLDVASSTETHRLLYRDQDDNRQRHCAIFALFDWCWGGDPQWLVAPGFEYHSHDHGWYLPPEGPTWAAAELQAAIELPHEYPGDTAGIAPEVAEAVASRLEAISHDDIRNALLAIPRSWTATDKELEEVGFFLEKRAAPVADRLRRRFPL